MAKGVDVVREARDEEEDAEKPGEEAHGATERKEEKTGEELKHGGRMHEKRAHGGKVHGHKAHDGMSAEMMKEHGKMRHHRKKGGRVPGHAAKARPDRRARGGGTSELHPTTAAGNMSTPDYERHTPITNGAMSSGPDKRKHGGHVRD